MSKCWSFTQYTSLNLVYIYRRSTHKHLRSRGYCWFRLKKSMWASVRSYKTDKFGDAYPYANRFSGFTVPHLYDCTDRPVCIAIYEKALAQLYM